jgi:hypothetical protein
MTALFSPQWMQSYAQKWNADPELADALAKIDFNATIGYGFKGDDRPQSVLVVENGQAVSAGAYTGQPLNWDLRADLKDWQKWLASGLTMLGLSAAYVSGKLKFVVGDYASMIKDPRMVGPFIKSFTVMGWV